MNIYRLVSITFVLALCVARVGLAAVPAAATVAIPAQTVATPAQSAATPMQAGPTPRVAPTPKAQGFNQGVAYAPAYSGPANPSVTSAISPNPAPTVLKPKAP